MLDRCGWWPEISCEGGGRGWAGIIVRCYEGDCGLGLKGSSWGLLGEGRLECYMGREGGGKGGGMRAEGLKVRKRAMEDCDWRWRATFFRTRTLAESPIVRPRSWGNSES